MIIVTQDKRMIINFNNVNVIRVANGRIYSYDNTYGRENDADLLGSYKDEERAKEVLNDIVNHYYNYELTKVYEMPTE